MDEIKIGVMGAVPLDSENQVTGVYVSIALDVMEALINNSVDDSLYMFDNAKLDGSTHQGTNHLATAVQAGDTIVWAISGLEVETYSAIKNITGPAVDACKIVEGGAPPLTYWSCKVPEDVEGTFEYTLDIQVESKVFTLSSKPSLVVSEGAVKGAVK